MSTDLQIASERRLEETRNEDIDRRVDLLLANYQRVTANPRTMGHLRFLLKHYAKSETPFRSCVADNAKRFGPGRVEKVCAVVKDTLRQSSHWRGHPSEDHGSPGVAIADADAPFAPAWGGHKHLAEAFVEEYGVEAPDEVFEMMEALGEKCDVYRVLIGLDEPPTFEELAL